MNLKILLTSLVLIVFVSCSNSKKTSPDTPFFKMRGIILSWADVQNPTVIDWIDIAKKNHINTISVFTANYGNENNDYTSPRYLAFKKKCINAGLDFEYEEHVLQHLLPRALFDTHPEYFRLDKNGVRQKDGNGCPSSEDGLRVIANHVKDFVSTHKPTNHKYYFWLCDGGDICHCEKCKNLNASDQALLFENRIIKALKVFDPKAQLCHIAYHTTTPAPKFVKPEEGIFLEFAPFYRRWDKPLSDTLAVREGQKWSHGDYLKMLEANLKVFPAETAQVLEYWMDVSQRSGWKKPAVKLDWNNKVYLADLDTYASYGIKNITAYAVYVDSAYVNDYKDITFVEDYGEGMWNYGKK